MTRETIAVEEFHRRLKAQGVSSVNHAALICPACGTVQSIDDFIRAGLTLEKAERQIGFSCIGRFTGAGSPRKAHDGKPCNWTLGGLFQIHNLIVVDTDGSEHPHFSVATPAQAKAHEASK